MPSNTLNSFEIEQLAVLVEEAIRSTESGIKRFIEPAPGTLQQAKNRTHSIVFGRRGSGKSSLLRKAAADLTVDRRPIAYVDLETFKGHSYPDVLLSVLIRTFKEFAKWLRTAAIYSSTRTSYWKQLFSSAPKRPSFNRKDAMQLAESLDQKVKELEDILYSSDESEIQRIKKQETDKRIQKETEVASSLEPIKLGAKIGGSQSSLSSEEVHESYQSNKTDFLLRHILEYQNIFRDMVRLSGGDSFLFLDDLYYIKRSDQARVIDYFHRIAKNNGLWLKIGTIRHRTDWYKHGDPPYGMKLGDDAHEINLDLTLEEYSRTKEFLMKVLEGFVKGLGNAELLDLIVDKAKDRLVLASGGVARDFLGIFRRSIIAAQTRGLDYRGPKIGVEDVNTATGQYSSTKKEEFKKDTVDDQEHTSLEESFQRVRAFCVNEAQTNLFLVEPNEANQGYAVIQELVDLRLVHKVNSRVTVSKRQGEIFEAYMLDVSEYTQSRKRKGFEEIMFWGKDRNEKMRKVSLILDANTLVGKRLSIEQKKGHNKADIETANASSRQRRLDSKYVQADMFKQEEPSEQKI
jgi:hypothetical protein